MTVFETDSRRALGYGIAAIAALAIGILAAIALVLLLPHSIFTYLLITLALVMALAIGWLGYHTFALANTVYALDRNAFVIRHGLVREIIPMGNVQRVVAGTDVAVGLRFRRIPLPGWWIGQGFHPALGKVMFYSGVPLARQIIVVTADANYAISPRDRDAFLSAFRMRFQMGPTQPVQPVRLVPSFMNWPLWSDHVALVMILVAAAMNALLFAVGFARFPELLAGVVLHFSAAGTPDRFGTPDQALGPALIALILLVLNTAVALAIYLRGEKLAAYLAWGGSVLVQLLFLIAMLTVTFTSL